ncbi:MAG: DUF4399 domain-containing protein [Pseudomonadota bacterium]
MRRKLFSMIALVGLAVSGPVFGQGLPSAEDASVYFVNIEDGASVSSPVKLIFGLSGMGVAPAGTEKEMTGHHHLLVDRPPLGEGEDGADEFLYSLPADDNHIHFGGGQTEVTLDLASGTHTLQLVLADMNHVPHSKPIVSEIITITVD